MTINIRPATPSDWAIIVEYNCALAFETEDKVLNKQLIIPGVKALLADAGKGLYRLAETNGQVVGQLMLTYEWSDWRNGWFWWIQSVYVHPDFRRKGVYRSLYEALHEEATRREDVCGIRLYVDQENHRAQKTYRALAMQAAHYDLYEVDFHFNDHESVSDNREE